MINTPTQRKQSWNLTSLYYFPNIICILNFIIFFTKKTRRVKLNLTLSWCLAYHNNCHFNNGSPNGCCFHDNAPSPATFPPVTVATTSTPSLPPTPGGSCTDREFSCKNGRCIDIRRRCNGFDECDDNSDEEMCGTLSTVTNRPWIPNVNKQILASYNLLGYQMYFSDGCGGLIQM